MRRDYVICIIKNLLQINPLTIYGIVIEDVSIPPHPGVPVYKAKDNLLSPIFNKIIKEKFELASAIGYIRGTKIPYPLDIKTLYFSKNQILMNAGNF